MKVSGRGWAYFGAGLGALVSVAANIGHSYVPPAGVVGDWAPQKGAVVGAVFWPVALLVAVEILARVVWPTGKRWVLLRYLGLLPVAVVAAVVSYRHMAGLLAWYGEDRVTSTMGPLAVDGLMVMATGALIATTRSRRQADDATEPVSTTASEASPGFVMAITPAVPEPVIEPVIEPADVTVKPASPRPSARPSRRPSSAASKVARVAARNPDLTAAQLAAKAGVSESTARRHLAATTTPPTDAPANGREPQLAATVAAEEGK